MSTRLALVMLLASAVAHADHDTYRVVASTPAPTPAPVVRIVRPAPAQIFKTTSRSGLPWCLMNDEDRVVELAVANWPMQAGKAGKAGIMIVVDSRWATTVYDVSKPIRLDSFIPFDPDRTGPLAECYWHQIVAFATLPTGESVKAPSAAAGVSFYNADAAPMRDGDIEYHRKDMYFVVNPMFPRAKPRPDADGYAWRKLDLVSANTATARQCKPQLSSSAASDADARPWPSARGIIEANTTGQEMAIGMTCATEPDRELSSTTEILAADARAHVPWPSMTGKQQAKQAADARRAHRLPGKDPYDGRFHATGGTSFGSLRCPDAVSIKNGALSFEPGLATVYTFGTLAATIDADGYVEQKALSFVPKRRAKQASDAELDRELAAIASLVPSGDMRSVTLGAGGYHAGKKRAGRILTLRLSATDATGAMTGRYCERDFWEEGMQPTLATCSRDRSTCGSGGGYLPCCD